MHSDSGGRRARLVHARCGCCRAASYSGRPRCLSAMGTLAISTDPGASLHAQHLRTDRRKPIRGWDGTPPRDSAGLNPHRRAGTDVAPKRAAGLSGRVSVQKEGAVPRGTIRGGPVMIRAFELSVPTNQAVAFSRASLRITWD